MDGKENQSVNQVGQPATTAQSLDLIAAINALNAKDTKPDYDFLKYENDDEIKNLRRKNKKFLKDTTTFADSKADTKEKIADLLSKFNSLVSETRGNHEKYISSRKNLAHLSGEKESLQNDMKKIENVTATLDSFSKELQKQNTLLIEENKKIQTDEKNIRVKIGEDFQTQINETSSQLEAFAKDHLHKSRENELLKEKLKEVEEKYGKREELFNEELTKRSGQFDNHYKDVEERFTAIENEANKSDEYTKELEVAKASAGIVEEKYTKLNEKSESFQKTMQESNVFFNEIKKEMDKMSVKIKKLDQENTQLQNKSEKADVSLVEMVGEYLLLKKELEKVDAQKEGLKKMVEDVLDKQKKELTEKIASLSK